MTESLDIEPVVAADALTTARHLARLQADEWMHPVVLHVCCRDEAGAGRAAYDSGHLPGAVLVELDHELGPRPLPGIAVLEECARRWGVRPGSSVVAYDLGDGELAHRVAWLLRWGGFADVQVLDDARAAWHAVGGRLASGAVAPVRGDVVLRGALAVAG